MKRRMFSLIMIVCVIFVCSVVLTACGGNTEAPKFYGKTFVLEKLTVDYDSEIDGTKLSAILEEHLDKIDWKKTIKANSSTIDSETFEEEVTTLARAKEIIDTFGKDLFGLKFAFDAQEAKTATVTLADDKMIVRVDDSDNQGVNAVIVIDCDLNENMKEDEEMGRVSLCYDDDTNNIEYLDFMPSEQADFKIIYTEEVNISGIIRSEFAFASSYHFTLQA